MLTWHQVTPPTVNICQNVCICSQLTWEIFQYTVSVVLDFMAGFVNSLRFCFCAFVPNWWSPFLLYFREQQCVATSRISQVFSILEERLFLRHGHRTPRHHFHCQAGAPQEPLPQLQKPGQFPHWALEGWRPAVSGKTLHEEKLSHHTGTKAAAAHVVVFPMMHFTDVRFTFWSLIIF